MLALIASGPRAVHPTWLVCPPPRFLLPAYFPLVLRAISSLEGVALSVDRNFKLINAGMPVVLNQLLSGGHGSAAWACVWRCPCDDAGRGTRLGDTRAPSTRPASCYPTTP